MDWKVTTHQCISCYLMRENLPIIGIRAFSIHNRYKLVVDTDGQITEDLSMFRQVKVLQAVLLLTRRVLFHKLLWKTADKNEHFIIITTDL